MLPVARGRRGRRRNHHRKETRHVVKSEIKKPLSALEPSFPRRGFMVVNFRNYISTMIHFVTSGSERWREGAGGEREREREGARNVDPKHCFRRKVHSVDSVRSRLSKSRVEIALAVWLTILRYRRKPRERKRERVHSLAESVVATRSKQSESLGSCDSLPGLSSCSDEATDTRRTWSTHIHTSYARC